MLNIFGDKPKVSEKEFIEINFDKGTLKNWDIVSRVDEMSTPWLCLNWALFRLHYIQAEKTDDAKLKKKGDSYIGNAEPLDTISYSSKDMLTRWANKWGLKSCGLDDPKRIMVIWEAEHENRGQVGHIQVKYHDRWESKLSTEYYVISHEENAFETFQGTASNLGMFKTGAMCLVD
ncbi:hypothetical protein K7432_014506 [Basidiobolus ranarum]